MKTILLFLSARFFATDGRILNDAPPLSISESSECKGITSVGNLGANYLTNRAPCLITPPQESYNIDHVELKTVEISYNSFDTESDTLTYTWTSDKAETCPNCFNSDGTKLTITPNALIANMTVNMEVIVSDADHATKYGFKVVVAPAPLSISESSECKGITSVENLGANYLTNHAPCLITPPEESYEVDLTF